LLITPSQTLNPSIVSPSSYFKDENLKTAWRLTQ
jgi:hypothetical protein